MAFPASRSYQKELLDRDDIPFADIRRNMQELSFINKYLGGHKITLDGFRGLTNSGDRIFNVVEIGCGGGDNLLMLKTWSEKKGIQLKLTGVDINPECILYANSLPENGSIHFIHSDYRAAIFSEKPDIIFSSLFCHHFDEDALQQMLKWMRDNSKIGFFINDLHRHPAAFYSIKFLTRLFSKSYLVRNDAPLSVKRGFVRNDWKKLMEAAGISNYSIEWKWAFRWLIQVFNNEQ
jgi:SAM-dependent methyltransferase